MVIRRRRTPTAGAVGVTGAGSGLGRALAERLVAGPDAPLAVGLDHRAAQVEGVQWRPADLAAPGLSDQLAGLDVVVHLAMSYDVAADDGARRRLNVAGTAALLAAARDAGVRRVVLVTSLDVHAAPPPGAALPVGEDLPLRGGPDSALTAELLEVERLADHAARTGLDVLVLRPAALVGGDRGQEYDGPLLRSLDAPRLLAVRGVEPLWQLCHADDLLAALETALAGGLTGRAAVASSGWLTQREVEQVSGRRRMELPASVALSTADRLHRAGLTPASAAQLDRLLAPLVVQPARLLDAGWIPSWTAADALQDYLDQRVPESGRTSYTAAGAGATVALVGTAALVRRARRRRRGR